MPTVCTRKDFAFVQQIVLLLDMVNATNNKEYPNQCTTCTYIMYINVTFDIMLMI